MPQSCVPVLTWLHSYLLLTPPQKKKLPTANTLFSLIANDINFEYSHIYSHVKK